MDQEQVEQWKRAVEMVKSGFMTRVLLIILVDGLDTELSQGGAKFLVKKKKFKKIQNQVQIFKPPS